MSPNKRIAIITQSHICRNPRVVKEAVSLSTAGFQVSIYTTFYNTELLEEDLKLIRNTTITLIPVVNIIHSSIQTFFIKVYRKIGTVLCTNFGLNTPYALGYAPKAYIKHLKKSNYDIFICHQELATWVGTKLINTGKKVAFDFEDWYSRDLLPEAQKQRPIRLLIEVERKALTDSALCWTTSNALSLAMANAYKTDSPRVLYNVFPTPTISETASNRSVMKFLWFSQTIGAGRGLEEAIDIFGKIRGDFELHLLGNVSETFKKKLVSATKDAYPLFFHPILSPDSLPFFISQFDVGLALELKKPDSRRLTITNKFFQYIQSGLPVIATNTDGQNEIINKTEAGISINFEDSEDSIRKISELVTNKPFYSFLKQKAIEAAETYNWDNEQSKLVDWIKKI